MKNRLRVVAALIGVLAAAVALWMLLRRPERPPAATISQQPARPSSPAPSSQSRSNQRGAPSPRSEPAPQRSQSPRRRADDPGRVVQQSRAPSEISRARPSPAPGESPAPVEPAPLERRPPIVVPPAPEAVAAPSEPAVEKSEAAADPRSFANDEAAVQGVLREYVDAFNRLDVNGTASVWPTIDRRALARIFDRIDRQQLAFRGCSVVLSSTDATARCDGSLTYVPRVGVSRSRLEAHVWTFWLRKSQETWHIVQMMAQ